MKLRIFFLLLTNIFFVSAALANSCPPDREKRIHRGQNFVEVSIENEQRLRLNAGAEESSISRDRNGRITLNTKWSVIGKPGCFFTTVEVFSYEPKAYQSPKIEVNGNTVTAKSDSYNWASNCMELSSGGDMSDYGRSLEAQARHNALEGCLGHSFSSCQEVSSSCVTVATNGGRGTASAWEVIMIGAP